MLDYELNSRILKLAPRHLAKAVAPESFETLASAATSGLVVYDGGSERTIYGDVRVNHAFRAWHDALHLKLGAPFNPLGEKRVAIEQARVLGGNYGLLIMAEVVGQIAYFEKHGMFPVDQVGFAVNYLKGLK